MKYDGVVMTGRFGTKNYTVTVKSRMFLYYKKMIKITSAAAAKSLQSCPTFCDPMDYTVLGILNTRILAWVAFPSSRRSSQLRDRTQVSYIAGEFYTI